MADDWKAALPPELAAEPMIQQTPDLATLAKIAVDLKKYQGSSLKPPSSDAGPEARKEFIGKLQALVPELIYLPEDPAVRAEAEVVAFERLGRPKDEKGYTLEGVQMPEGVTLDPAALAATAKALGLTKAQFKALAAGAAGEMSTTMTQEASARAALKVEWGQAYDDRVGSAKAAALKQGVPAAAVDAMPASQLKVWANVAKSIGTEPRQVADQGAGANGRMTPAEAQAAMQEIRNRPEFWDPNKNAALRARMDVLTPMAYPE
jgi:hypothetical protein